MTSSCVCCLDLIGWSFIVQLCSQEAERNCSGVRTERHLSNDTVLWDARCMNPNQSPGGQCSVNPAKHNARCIMHSFILHLLLHSNSREQDGLSRPCVFTILIINHYINIPNYRETFSSLRTEHYHHLLWWVFISEWSNLLNLTDVSKVSVLHSF